MVLVDDGTAIVAVATISTIGFAITLGIPTLTSSAWLTISQFTPFQRLREFGLRYIGKFAEDGWVRLFHIPAILFLVALVLDLGSIAIARSLLDAATWACLLGVVMTLGMAIAVLVDAHLLSVTEIDTILKFYTRRSRRKQAKGSAKKRDPRNSPSSTKSGDTNTVRPGGGDD